MRTQAEYDVFRASDAREAGARARRGARTVDAEVALAHLSYTVDATRVAADRASAAKCELQGLRGRLQAPWMIHTTGEAVSCSRRPNIGSPKIHVLLALFGKFPVLSSESPRVLGKPPVLSSESPPVLGKPLYYHRSLPNIEETVLNVQYSPPTPGKRCAS